MLWSFLLLFNQPSNQIVFPTYSLVFLYLPKPKLLRQFMSHALSSSVLHLNLIYWESRRTRLCKRKRDILMKLLRKREQSLGLFFFSIIFLLFVNTNALIVTHSFANPMWNVDIFFFLIAACYILDEISRRYVKWNVSLIKF